MRKSKYIVIVPLAIVLIIMGCYPEGPESNSDYDLVLSAHDPNFAFDSVSTFVMPDTLVMLNDITATELVEITDIQKAAILESVRGNYIGYGWQDLTETNDTAAETIVLVSAIVAKYSDTTIWNKWEWYEGFENVQRLSTSSRYPWYPSEFPYIYDFTKGTLLVTMIDAVALDTSSTKIPVVWMGSLNGIITSKVVNTTNVLNAIDKMFELTPQLDKN